MASIYEREPIFLLERTWDDKTKLPAIQMFSGKYGKKAKVHINNGSLGMEFFYEKTLPDFCLAGDELFWNWTETFSKSENVLAGSYKTAWRQVVKDHYTPLPAEAGEEELKKSFFEAITCFVCTILDSDTPQEEQYIYLEPGGDYCIVKDLLMPLREHAR